MLFNEPKLLKRQEPPDARQRIEVSVLFNEPKLLKFQLPRARWWFTMVSVLFNEPKLLKCTYSVMTLLLLSRFSALQRAEIAEMFRSMRGVPSQTSFSALQRAEIAEMCPGTARSSVI